MSGYELGVGLQATHESNQSKWSNLVFTIKTENVVI